MSFNHVRTDQREAQPGLRSFLLRCLRIVLKRLKILAMELIRRSPTSFHSLPFADQDKRHKMQKEVSLTGPMAAPTQQKDIKWVEVRAVSLVGPGFWPDGPQLTTSV